MDWEIDDIDFYKAIELSLTTNRKNDKISITDPLLEFIDTNPDIYKLFYEFNQRYFYGRLYFVEVKWSKRMTLCAGLCAYQYHSRYCCIKLSEPILKYRPRKDLIETLLHEMIHAYLFVTLNNKDRESHGPEFRKHMNRINNEAGTKITIYHSFHDEVRYYRKHWWRCNGPCQYTPPYYGYIKRAINRAPGPSDSWWSQHSSKCNGKFIKISEPIKSISNKKSENIVINNDRIENFFSPKHTYNSNQNNDNRNDSNRNHNINNNNNNNNNIVLYRPLLFESYKNGTIIVDDDDDDDDYTNKSPHTTTNSG